MKRDPACHSPEHTFARRDFLGALAGTGAVVGGGLGALAAPAASKQLERDQKRVIVVYMSGGLSQLESWDPKPKTDTGGPFRAIPTSVPGVHISELLPLTAKHMDKLALVRSINTKNGDHGKGRYQMTYGRNQVPGLEIPHIGAVAARALEDSSSPLPGHVHVPSGTGKAAYLGPKYNSIGLKGDPPANSARAGDLTADADARRNDFRRRLNDRFAGRRRTAETDVYTVNHERALDLMEQRDVFDVTKEPDAEHEKYGKYDLGKHMLLSRRLLEHGVTFVQVSHSNYDTHNENFAFHLEQLGEFDRSFAALVGDLSDRGMLESTLVVVMSEFGRTPRINARYGRDHWGNSWSICLGGGRVQGGAVIGKTNENGMKVTDREVDHGHLFHTYLEAVGLDSTGHFDINGRPQPMADPARSAISELLT